MNERERFLRTMRYQPVDRRPLYLVGIWEDTVRRWKTEGLPGDVTDVDAHLGVKSFSVVNVTGIHGIYPPFQERFLCDEGDTTISIDDYGRTVRNFKNHTSMPEWIDFPVKQADDLRRVLDEHFDVTDLAARFDATWEERLKRIGPDDVVLLNAGCYYWTLRSLAGVEHASYLFYDAPELVDELFERYFIVVMEGLARVSPRVRIDVMGFGEDIAGRNGPLAAPDMIRSLIMSRYAKTMAAARAMGIDLSWYDSDGDVRMLIPDYLKCGIHCLAPCEVAAGMDPVALRRDFGKDLRLVGGFDKRIVAKGPAAIDAEFARLRPVIEEGGFIPAIDHSVSADISYDNYRYFVDGAQRSLNFV